MNRIQSKENRIGTFKINKMSYIQNNEYDGLAFGYQS